ncbi:hypothetical protein C1280_20815 [Gemmata obscuriglobus]|uniref:Transposase n=1 Tax=Gemmata obscuriglobus TaxID=114 RepID=A0A2Z3HEY3_9BACT|nr:hypothetical protein C1280_20815 [Gemmata obscuriglobus]
MRVCSCHLTNGIGVKVKQYRRVATRYKKTARNFLAFIHIASIIIWIQWTRCAIAVGGLFIGHDELREVVS